MRNSLLAALMAASALIPGAAFADRADRGEPGDPGRGGNRQAQFEARGQARAEQSRPEQARPEQARPEQPRQEQARQEQARPEQPRFDRGNADANGGRVWNRGNRGDGGQRNDYSARPQPQVQQPPVQQPQARLNGNQGRGGRPDVRGNGNGNGGQWRGDRGGNPAQFAPGAPNRGNDWRGNGNRGNGNDWRGNSGRPDNRNGNRYDNRGGNDRGVWNRDWRGDNRYDWNRRRQYDRNAFHLPRYYAPRGWSYGYRRFNIGFTLSAGLFANNYWIEDPYYYGLPEAYGPYRWVRYYNDALLVDVYSGEVVDTVYDIFW